MTRVTQLRLRELQVTAYNLCNGRRTQGEVAKTAGLENGDCSRTVARWVESDVQFRVGSGRDATVLYLDPLVKGDFEQTWKLKAAGKPKGTRKRQGR